MASFATGHVPLTYELKGSVVLQAGAVRYESTGGTYCTKTRTLVSDAVRVSNTAEATKTMEPARTL